MSNLTHLQLFYKRFCKQMLTNSEHSTSNTVYVGNAHHLHDENWCPVCLDIYEKVFQKVQVHYSFKTLWLDFVKKNWTLFHKTPHSEAEKIPDITDTDIFCLPFQEEHFTLNAFISLDQQDKFFSKFWPSCILQKEQVKNLTLKFFYMLAKAKSQESLEEKRIFFEDSQKSLFAPNNPYISL